MPTLTTLEISLAVLVLEFGAIALWFGFLLRKRSVESVTAVQKETEAAVEFAEAVVEKEPSRRDALELIFREKYNLDEDKISDRVNEFVDRERAFYQTLIATFAKRDGESLVEIGEQLNNVIAPWISLVPEGMVAEEELAGLNQANETLTAELEHNKAVLEELMTEYDRAFHKEKVVVQEEQDADGEKGIDLFGDDDDGELLVEVGDPESDEDSGRQQSDAAAEKPADGMDLDLSPEAAAEDEDAGDSAGELVGDAGVGEEPGNDAAESEAGTEDEPANGLAEDDEIKPLNAGEIDDLLESLDSEPA